LGIEPSSSLSNACEQSGHHTVRTHLDERTAHTIRIAHGRAAAVICRHTLEHVAVPASLLQSIALLLDEGGVLFLEVPDSAPVVDGLRAFELWDEHLSYFSTSNLRRILTASGFAIEHIDVVSHLDSRNIVCWARKTARNSLTESKIDATKLLSKCRTFCARWKAYRQTLLQRSRHWATPIIAMGASHPQSNFLLFSGIGHLVTGLVDEDAQKAGRWVALPQPTPVFHPQELVERLGSGTLLLTGFGYERWTREMRRRFSATGVSLIDPFDAAATANPS
jgi:hypothetical protein